MNKEAKANGPRILPGGLTWFRMTPAHITLLRRAYVSWDDCEYGAPAIDPKRPYGNSDVPGDIAELLGDADGDTLRLLHEQTKTALQIVLATGVFEPGAYRTVYPYDARSWERTSDVTTRPDTQAPDTTRTHGNEGAATHKGSTVNLAWD